jgi:transposase
MKRDARRLSRSEQENLRKRVVKAVHPEGAMTIAEAARQFEVSRYAVYKWRAAYTTGGEGALAQRTRGPKSALSYEQIIELREWLRTQPPEALDQSCHLWTCIASAALVQSRFGKRLSRATLRKYLSALGILRQDDSGYASLREMNRYISDSAIRRWLESAYPKVVSLARRDGADIFWFERAIYQLPERPVIGLSAEKTLLPPQSWPSFNRLSAVSNRGEFYFLGSENPSTPNGLLDFIQRLVRERQKKVILILPKSRSFRSGPMRSWCAAHGDQIQLEWVQDPSRAY